MEKKNNNKIKELVIYQAKSGEIKFRGDIDGDTIWGTQKQIAEVFGVERSVITKHINKIFKDDEVDKKVVCAKFAHTTPHGAIKGKTQTKNVKIYNLDIILAVGYRTNSGKAIEFRKWSTKILREHITKGYTINKKVLVQNYGDFMQAVESVQKLLPKENTIPTENILELVKAFAGTWFSLESYDEDKFPQKGFTKKKVQVTSEELYDAVAKFKKELVRKKQASNFFAQEKRVKNLEGILGNVLQIAFGREMYPTVEEKAAHLLYFVVKNHPFNDGNKRTGAFSFIWFLQKTGIEYRDKITPEALTAITLLIAISKPSEKERMIGLVLLLLKK